MEHQNLQLGEVFSVLKFIDKRTATIIQIKESLLLLETLVELF